MKVEDMEYKVKPADAKMAWAKPVGETEKENIGSLWSDFTQNTGFHGVNKLSPGTHYRFRCLWWSLAVLGMAGYLGYIVYRELTNYYKYPTMTVLKVQPVEHVPFPAVTICNQSPFNLSRVKQADPSLEIYFLKTSKLGHLTGPMNWSDPMFGPLYWKSSDLDWWKRVAMDPREMLTMCIVNGVHYNPCSTILKVSLTDHGFCATYNWNPKDIVDIRVPGDGNNFIAHVNIFQHMYTYGEEVAAGLRVFLHDPSVSPDAASSSFVAGPGMSTYAAVKRTSYKYLAYPFKAFGNKTCLNTKADNFTNPLTYYKTYTHEHCMLECVLKKVHDICNCSKPSLEDPDLPVCSIFNFTECYFPQTKILRQNAKFLDSCDCPMSCEYNLYETKVASSKYPSNIWKDFIIKMGRVSNAASLRDNFLELRVYYENLMQYSIEQVPQYTTEALVGNLGGQMGICLGASILTLTELGEFLFILGYTIFKRLTNTRQAAVVKK